jgi:hypothetical protein
MPLTQKDRNEAASYAMKSGSKQNLPDAPQVEMESVAKKADITIPEGKVRVSHDPQREFEGTGGYVYEKMQDGRIKILKSPASSKQTLIDRSSPYWTDIMDDINMVQVLKSEGRWDLEKKEPKRLPGEDTSIPLYMGKTPRKPSK